jgi:hypothetical protein
VKDWKAIARAHAIEVSDEELERIVGTLNALEEAFRPLTKDLPASLEPATGICGKEGAE